MATEDKDKTNTFVLVFCFLKNNTSECNLDNFYSKSEVDSLLQAYEDRISALEDLVNNGG